MSAPKITLATSLVPAAPSNVQERTVESWLDAGFEIVSLNGAEEAEQVRSIYPMITVAEAARTGQLMAGRPVVYINDLLEVLGRFGTDIVGLINADIYIAPHPELIATLVDAAQDSLLAIPRLEVPNYDSVTGQIDRLGFDSFIFPRRLLNQWTDARFCLGMPFWDHWFPLITLLRGENVVRLESSYFRHIPHPTSRDDSFFLYTDEFVMQAFAALREARAQELVGHINIDDLSSSYIELKKTAMTVNNDNADENEREPAFQALAEFQDHFTKLIVRLLHDGARTAQLG